jgi:predicted MPP superfamily phosphohydrolase
MMELGWSDIAGAARTIDAGRSSFLLGGDETPWFGQHPPLDREIAGMPRLLLSHTPDVFPWGAGAGIDVILAGHNHGGQVLLPGIGPVYTPSVYGCRYPAGVFASHRTAMHVSRGLAGRHPLRIGSRPEITRLTIRSPATLAREATGHAAQLRSMPALLSSGNAAP